jgi:branched-chain amino acid transport system ATP-binding protein
MNGLSTPLLVMKDIRVHYGRLAALKGISISVETGMLACIVGPNGAGKSTTLAAIAGGVSISDGSVYYDGANLSHKSPEAIARLGISLVPEGRHIFGTLTVEENLRMGSFARKDRAGVAGDLSEVLAMFPNLKERRAGLAGNLSGGEQQMLAIGRALMARPRLLMIDEPSLGLAPKIVDQVYEILFDLRRRSSITLLVNEQNSKRIVRYADHVYVLRDGVVRLDDAAENLREGDAVERAYFGFHPNSLPASAEVG